MGWPWWACRRDSAPVTRVELIGFVCWFSSTPLSLRVMLTHDARRDDTSNREGAHRRPVHRPSVNRPEGVAKVWSNVDLPLLYEFCQAELSCRLVDTSGHLTVANSGRSRHGQEPPCSRGRRPDHNTASASRPVDPGTYAWPCPPHTWHAHDAVRALVRSGVSASFGAVVRLCPSVRSGPVCGMSRSTSSVGSVTIWLCQHHGRLVRVPVRARRVPAGRARAVGLRQGAPEVWHRPQSLPPSPACCALGVETPLDTDRLDVCFRSDIGDPPPKSGPKRGRPIQADGPQDGRALLLSM